MMKKLFFLLSSLIMGIFAFAQTPMPALDYSYKGSINLGTGVGTYSATSASTLLQLGPIGTTKAIIMPRVNDTANVVTPLEGMVVYSLTTHKQYVRTTGRWEEMTTSYSSVFLKIADTSAMLFHYGAGVSLAVPTALFSATPINFTLGGKIFSGTASLASQSAFTVFARGSGSGTPTFQAIDTTYISGFAAKVRSLFVGGTGIIFTNGTITVNSSNVVTSFSGGTTGLLPSTATSGDITLTGVVNIANGGTGLTSTTAHFAFIGPTSGSGAPTWRALVSSDIPSLSGYVPYTGATADVNLGSHRIISDGADLRTTGGFIPIGPVFTSEYLILGNPETIITLYGESSTLGGLRIRSVNGSGTGSVDVFNINSAHLATFFYGIAGTLTTPAQTNITSLGNLITLSVAGASTFGGPIVTTTGNGTRFQTTTGATTGTLYMDIINSSGRGLFGLEGSVAGTLLTGTSAYATVIGSAANQAFQLITNGIVRATITTGGDLKMASGKSYGFAMANGSIHDMVGSGQDGIQVESGDGTHGVYILYGQQAWSAFSDERLKENLEPITNSIEKVLSLRAVVGNLIADKEKGRHPYLIAQDVKKVLPEAVVLMNKNTGTLGLNYTEVIPLLVAFDKDLYSLFVQLRSEFDQYKAAHK